MKKKIATIITGALLLSPVASSLSFQADVPIINKKASAKTNIKYKLADVQTRTISVQEQKDNAKGQYIGKTLAELAIGGVGIKGAKTAMAILGFSDGWNTIQNPKQYSPITAKKYHYVPTKKLPGGDMSGFNHGYYIIKLYDQKTGKYISSKKIGIQRA